MPGTKSTAWKLMALLCYSTCSSVVQWLKDAPVVPFFYAPPEQREINSFKSEIWLYIANNISVASYYKSNTHIAM